MDGIPGEVIPERGLALKLLLTDRQREATGEAVVIATVRAHGRVTPTPMAGPPLGLFLGDAYSRGLLGAK